MGMRRMVGAELDQLQERAKHEREQTTATMGAALAMADHTMVVIADNALLRAKLAALAEAAGLDGWIAAELAGIDAWHLRDQHVEHVASDGKTSVQLRAGAIRALAAAVAEAQAVLEDRRPLRAGEEVTAGE